MAEENETLSREQMQRLRAVRDLLDGVVGEGSAARSAPNYGNLIRAFNFVLAGIIASATTLGGVLLVSILDALGLRYNMRRLYLEIFGDLLVWIALIIFSATVAATVLQLFRAKLNRPGAWVRLWVGLSVLVMAAPLVSAYMAAEVAVCGGAALTIGVTEDKVIETHLPAIPRYLFACDSRQADWFPPNAACRGRFC